MSDKSSVTGSRLFRITCAPIFWDLQCGNLMGLQLPSFHVAPCLLSHTGSAKLLFSDGSFCAVAFMAKFELAIWFYTIPIYS